ncbi:calcitonin gene-related peptide type 1 receptor-like [Centruroides vittatus]|uniref:calcitonin gene-related peptide type 1 receptor-like n=1 Tax=Centruroides vittatus TaxID=120091 RepID=UPI00350F7714
MLVLFIIEIQAFVHLVSSETNKNDKLSADKYYTLADQLRAYWNCHLTADRVPKNYQEGQLFCPPTFDGWGCWDATPAGQVAKQQCPLLVTKKQTNKFVTKYCTQSGKWFSNPDRSEKAANYSQCPFDVVLNTDQELLFYLFDEFAKLEEIPYSVSAIEYAFNQCIDNVLSQPRPKDGRKYCLRTFDGWGCWNDTPAGETAYITCPTFITGFLPERFAHKICNEDGTWYRHPHTNRTWSNYTTCIDQDDLSFRQRINNFYIAGYSTSLVAVTISLIIFCYFKSLQCTRITIHKNLFISFIINNSMWIIWYTAVVQNTDVLLKNEVGCQILHVFVHYFLVSNYFWMFCEGLYLHTLLVVAFLSEGNLMKWFYLLGWGAPALLIIAYAATRTSFPEQTLHCWIEESIYMWIISGPVCVSMTLNFIFLVNIVRVLVTKLRAVNSPDAHQTRKAVRATLILIPLLGLHYVVTPFRPEPRSHGEAVYETISAVVSSFQGLFVALLFCFFNGEIITLLRREWYLRKMGKENSNRRVSNLTSTTSISLGRQSSTSNNKPLLST